MAFSVKNERKIRLFYMSGKTGSVCIAAKNGQGAFLITEKWGGQDTFWAAEKQVRHCALLKMPRVNTTERHV